MNRRMLGFFGSVQVRLIGAALALTSVAVFVGKLFLAGPPSHLEILRALEGREVLLRPALAIGAADAPVGVVVFSDFECPYCAELATGALRSAADEMVRLGTIRLAFKHFPLDNAHPAAFELATLAECAARQGQFWTVHDALFRHPTQQDRRRRWRIIDKSKFNESELQSCQEGSGAESVQADLLEGRSLRINGTPTVLVGRHTLGRVVVSKVIDGVPDKEQFLAAISEAANASR